MKCFTPRGNCTGSAENAVYNAVSDIDLIFQNLLLLLFSYNDL
jgi:hypothetical protein